MHGRDGIDHSLVNLIPIFHFHITVGLGIG